MLILKKYEKGPTHINTLYEIFLAAEEEKISQVRGFFSVVLLESFSTFLREVFLLHPAIFRKHISQQDTHEL